VCVGVTAFMLQAVAVRNGALVVVQPLIMSGIVFAVPVRAALERRRPSTSDVLWVSVTVTGLALFVIVANPHTVPDGSDKQSAARIVAVASALLAAASWGARRLDDPKPQGLLVCAAAGVAFGLVPGLLKMALLMGADDLVRMAVIWPIAAMLGMGAVGFSLNQRAYRLLPLPKAMPLVNVISLIAAVAFGWLVFDERPAHDVISVLIELGALALMGIGVRRLLTIARQHETESPHHRASQRRGKSGRAARVPWV
jgi:drug/metabolite transporter (DMT)-like permease